METTWWQLCFTVIGSMSVGSIISACISIGFQQRKFQYETKLNIYSNLIQSWNSLSSNSDTCNNANFDSLPSQVGLIGSEEVVKNTEMLRVSRSNKIFEKLTASMRDDLKRSN